MVEVDAAQYRTQRGLGDLQGRRVEVLDLGDRTRGVHHPVVGDGRHADRDVVSRDHLLWRDRQRDGAQAHPHHAVDRRHEHDQAGSLRRHQPSKAKDHAPLVLPEHAYRGGRSRRPDRQQHPYHDDDYDDRDAHATSSQFSAFRTHSVRPLTRSTTTWSPSCSGSSSGNESRARHKAPSTKTVPAGSAHRRTTPRCPMMPSEPVWILRRRTATPLCNERATTAAPTVASATAHATTSAIPPPRPVTASTAPAVSAATPGTPKNPSDWT